MTTLRGVLVASALCVLLSAAPAAPDLKEPSLGFLYPAGGRQGATVTIAVGGQNLRGTDRILVTGEGVTGKVVKYSRGGRVLQSEVLQELGRRMRALTARRIAEASGQRGRGRDGARSRRDPPPSRQGAKKAAEEEKKDEEKKVELPDHPLLRNLDTLGLRELKKVASYFFDPTRRLQASPALSEFVTVEITLAAHAAPGRRELRLLTPTGLSNSMAFEVGTLPEVAEEEVNDFTAMRLPALDSPITVNGQIDVMDIDRFRFKASRGQKLVFETHARKLVPYVADAVPGWFQAVLTLRNIKGEEVGFDDDFRFDPDPVLLFEVPEDGEYELEVRDSIYRGREDFVYRITMGERPFVASMFPLGGREGFATSAEVSGWNLDAKEVALDTSRGGPAIRTGAWGDGLRITNRLTYAVDETPDCGEVEPNDTVEGAQPIVLPKIVNGRIDRPGDVDVFRVKAKAGDWLAAEVCGRLLDSPLDSLLKVTDEKGEVIALNDDYQDDWKGLIRGVGLHTHQADSYLMAKLPRSGTYYVRISDAQGHGGEAYAYRLRVGPPEPDFTVLVTPSRLNVPRGSSAIFTVHALRKDGFDGDIELTLEGAPKDFRLSGGTIPAGCESLRMTLSGPRDPVNDVIPLKIVARAKIGKGETAHPVVPADDRMQAFLWRHLVPTEELLAVLPKSRWGVAALPRDGPPVVKIPAGGTARVSFRLPGTSAKGNKSKLVLGDPPKGITIRDVGLEDNAAVIVLETDRKEVEVGSAGNLIFEVYTEYVQQPRKQDGDAKTKTPPQTRVVFSGFLPAVPYRITRR